MANLDAPLRIEGGPGEGFPGASTAEATAASARPGALHRIVIVGGGAGGLELATRLGDKLGKRNRAHVTLIERARTHFWKPHLHEIAAGSMDLGVYETNYLAQSHWHYFRYRVGEMIGLNRNRRSVTVAPFVDEDGDKVTPQREFSYDTLVIAVGSQTNDFGTPGAKEYAISLETPAQAERFHRRLVNAYIRAHAQAEPLRPEQLQVAIIGAGATGVELAAELHNTTRTLVSYGLDRIDPEKDMKLILIEAADRIVPALPPRLSEAATKLLAKLNVNVRTSARVAEVFPTACGWRLARSFRRSWSSGPPASRRPIFSRTSTAWKPIASISSSSCRHCKRRATRIFSPSAIAPPVPWLGKEGAQVPPRAQAAHQQASHMVKQIESRLRDGPLAPWRYRDFGSLVSLGEYSVVGKPDGRADRSQPLDRGLVRPNDVRVAVQDA